MNGLDGAVKVIYRTAVSVGAALTEVDLFPGEDGVVWQLLWATGEQNDGDVICAWKWYDPESGGVNLPGCVVSANIPLAFGAWAPSQQGYGGGLTPIINSRYPSYAFNASAAGKTGVVIALVVEQIGVEGAL